MVVMMMMMLMHAEHDDADGDDNYCYNEYNEASGDDHGGDDEPKYAAGDDKDGDDVDDNDEDAYFSKRIYNSMQRVPARPVPDDVDCDATGGVGECDGDVGEATDLEKTAKTTYLLTDQKTCRCKLLSAGSRTFRLSPSARFCSALCITTCSILR